MFVEGTTGDRWLLIGHFDGYLSEAQLVIDKSSEALHRGETPATSQLTVDDLTRDSSCFQSPPARRREKNGRKGVAARIGLQIRAFPFGTAPRYYELDGSPLLVGNMESEMALKADLIGRGCDGRTRLASVVTNPRLLPSSPAISQTSRG